LGKKEMMPIKELRNLKLDSNVNTKTPTDWNSLFESFSREELGQLLRLVERNEILEKESLKREFQDRIEPIIDALRLYQ
jgi:hypothetical protein